MIREISVADCVHHCGFRYGRNEFNPYENYITGLANGHRIEELRDGFTDFIRHYRPEDLGEALNVATSRSIPLWLQPWKSWRKLFRPGGWEESAATVLDILTHFSQQGVLWTRIEEEFSWLERAFHSIRDQGYQPEQHGFIEVFELRGAEESRFLVIDGNHRISAIHALGATRVLVRQPMHFCAHRNRARFWQLVLSGHIPHKDALAIFDGYFRGNQAPFRAQNPATLLY